MRRLWRWGRAVGRARAPAVSLLLVNAGFGFVAVLIVLAAIVAVHLRALRGQMATALGTAFRGALTQAYASESATGSGLAVNLGTLDQSLAQDFAAAVGGQIVACDPNLPGPWASACQQGGFAVQVQATSAPAQGATAPAPTTTTYLIDVGDVSYCQQASCAFSLLGQTVTTPGPAVAAVAEMTAPTPFGFAVPLVAGIWQPVEFAGQTYVNGPAAPAGAP